MSDFLMTVSIDGFAVEDWAARFHAQLAQAPEALGLRSEVGGAGVLGAKRRGTVKVRAADTGDDDKLIKVLGLVVSALSLAVATAQLGIKLHEAPVAPAPTGPEFVCRVEGPQGVHELRIQGAAIPSEAVLRKCLDVTGAPTHITARPFTTPTAQRR